MTKPCIEWHMAKVGGYGIYSRKAFGRTYVHRMVCAFFHGDPPPGKPFALHSCDNRACYEPTHLRWGSAQENSDDMVSRGRAPTGDRNGSRKHPESRRRGSAHHRAKLNEEQVSYVRAEYARGRTQQNIADELGVTQVAISCITTGKQWRHVA